MLQSMYMQLTAQKIQSDFIGLRPHRDWSFRDIQRKETNSYTHGYHYEYIVIMEKR